MKEITKRKQIRVGRGVEEMSGPKCGGGFT